jgi:hypothetical protein
MWCLGLPKCDSVFTEEAQSAFTWVIFLFSAVSWLKLGLLEGCHILLHPFVGLQLELTNINYVLAY